MEPEQRVSELEAALAEAKEQLQARDVEIAELKAQLQEAQEAGGPRVAAAKVEEIQRLQEQLVALKSEQSVADAAKDAAWHQLKATVVQVCQLANPDKISEQSSHWR